MKKPEIARQIARKTGISSGEAADRLDGLVRRILADLRSGKPATFPGLGQLRAGPSGEKVFDLTDIGSGKGRARG